MVWTHCNTNIRVCQCFCANICVFVKTAQSKEGVFVFYDKLKEECKKQGLKMTPLIVECGGSPGSLSAWKKGVMPNAKLLLVIAKKLNVSPYYLLGLKDEQP